MGTKGDELLYLLMWSADLFFRPTFRNLTDSYESWMYRNGFHHQLRRLEAQQLIERDQHSDDRVYRLTMQGQLRALGGRDPQAQWDRDWDGRWRMILFDVPNERNAHRNRLRFYLRTNGFGYLQNSVWITPDPLENEREILADGRIDVESLILLEARSCAGESDAEIVNGAWNFEAINLAYERCLKVLNEKPTGPLSDRLVAKALESWAAEERGAWLEAVSRDPLLPKRILPPGYLGRECWERRKQVLRQARKQIQTFAK